MATKENPSARAASTVSSRLIPPSRIRGRESGVEELAGVGKEVRLLEGILDWRNREPTTRNPARRGAGSVAANSARGASPRKRNIGLDSELPPVSSMASSAPSDSSIRPNSRLSSSQNPPSTPSAMLSLAVTAARSPTASRTALTTCTREAGPVDQRAAPAVGAAVELGTQEGAEEIVVAEMDLDAVEPGLDGQGGAEPVVLGDPGDVLLGDGPGQSATGVEPTAMGPGTAVRLDRALATGPA